MLEFLELVLLGLGPGAIFGLLGISIIAVYRGSGVINFAAGAMAMSSAFIYYALQNNDHWPIALAVIVSVIAGALLGLVVYQVALRPLENRSVLFQIIATLGILIILVQVASLIFGSNTYLPSSVFPTSALHFGKLYVGWNRIWMMVTAVVFTTLLTGYYKLTRTGLASTALAENPLSVVTQGFSPVWLKTLTWTIGGSLMGVAGILIAPITGLSTESLTLLVVEALAAALVGNLSSSWGTLGGAVLIGAAESLTTGYIFVPGASSAVPLIAILLILVLRGKKLPARGDIGLRLPAVGSGKIRVLPLVIVSAFVLVSIYTWIPQSWVIAIMVSAVIAILCLSLVVLTGYTGQLSLAQIAIAGLGALAGSWTAEHWHVPFIVCLLFGGLAVVPLGFVIAGISSRVRGANLAVATMSVGVIVEALVFDRLVGGNLPNPSFLGFSINPISHPTSYAAFCIGVLILLSLLVAYLRKSKLGRRMLAVRANELAASSMGINVVMTKIWAFAISSFIAGVAGVLLLYQGTYSDFSIFDVFTSINVVVWTVIGGVGYILGPLFASSFAGGGLGTAIGDLFNQSVQNYLPLAGGVLLILLLIQNPDGVALQNIQMTNKIGAMLGTRFSRKTRSIGVVAPPVQGADDIPPIEDEHLTIPLPTDAPIVLSVRDISVAFGGVRALSSVSLDVRAGEIVGLIGSNGAGKTTLIDVVTGMTKPNSGTVEVGNVNVNKMPVYRRARAGLGRSFQSLELFDELSITDNLSVAQQKGLGGGKPRTFTGGEDIAISRETIAMLGLSDRMASTPESLSYGQRRLLAVARSLATNPSVMLLDEPAAGLDEVDVARLSNMLRHISREASVGVLLVEHNVSMVMEVSDRIFVLNAGQLIASGTPAEIRENPQVIESYLGVSAQATDHPVKDL